LRSKAQPQISQINTGFLDLTEVEKEVKLVEQQQKECGKEAGSPPTTCEDLRYATRSSAGLVFIIWYIIEESVAVLGIVK